MAFVPAVMVLIFLLLSFVLNQIDLSNTVKSIGWIRNWFSLKDVESARAIVSTVAAGIITLTVFSFTMVMIVMNQVAGNMSNRILDNLVGNKFQKTVLGFYIGTITFALALLSNISDAQEGEYLPSISVYFLILLTLIDIFLFVYFLQYITNSIMYGQIIKRIHNSTKDKLNHLTKRKNVVPIPDADSCEGETIDARESGYFQRFNSRRMIEHAKENKIIIKFLRKQGEYVIEGTPLFSILGNKVSKECIDKVFTFFEFYYGQEIDNNPYYGFQHLMEVAVKALSPGVNDQGTAILSLHALTDLICNEIRNPSYSLFSDEDGNPRVITIERTVEELFSTSILPIWDYGKKDRLIQKTFVSMIEQIQYLDKAGKYKKLFFKLTDELEVEIKKKEIE
ncbi:MAG: DUF2254 domain-containing protein [Bacteroidia bacterium]